MTSLMWITVMISHNAVVEGVADMEHVLVAVGTRDSVTPQCGCILHLDKSCN
jgi:hypothetical protein